MQAQKKDRAIQGIVIEALPSTTFKVKISDSPAGGEEVLAYLSGKMRLHHIKVLPGDRVLVELSEDGKRGRIIRRL